MNQHKHDKHLKVEQQTNSEQNFEKEDLSTLFSRLKYANNLKSIKNNVDLIFYEKKNPVESMKIKPIADYKDPSAKKI